MRIKGKPICEMPGSQLEAILRHSSKIPKVIRQVLAELNKRRAKHGLAPYRSFT